TRAVSRPARAARGRAPRGRTTQSALARVHQPPLRPSLRRRPFRRRARGRRRAVATRRDTQLTRAAQSRQTAVLSPHFAKNSERNVALAAIAINCTLKRSGKEPSSTDKMIELIAGELRRHGVEVRETIRIADHDIKPGVTSDEGPGDAWPDLRRRILDADILIFGTPVWLGQMSSI